MIHKFDQTPSHTQFSLESITALNEIDVECGDLLAELHNLWLNPVTVTNPFNIESFRTYLEGHEDQSINIHLIEDGYPLHLSDRTTHNLSKAVHNIVRDKRDLKEILKRMVKEAKKGQISGTVETSHYTLNLLCVPKKDMETNLMTAIRVARHGSFSTKHTVSINDKIDRDCVKIPTLPNIRKYIQLLIQYEYVSLRDLKDAFRQLGLESQDSAYIQYVLFGLVFRDNRQAYGVASASANCQHFAMMLIWILEKKLLTPEQAGRVLVHIDDFILAAHTKADCQDITLSFDQMCADLNVKISTEKNEDWVQKGIVHGFGFDLTANPKTVHIPDHKFHELITALTLCIQCGRVTGEALESICGKIMHWSQFRHFAKVLCYRMLGFIFHYIRDNKYLKWKVFHLTREILDDMRFWLRFASYIRVVTMESIVGQPSITVFASSDASSRGAGCVVDSQWGFYKFRSNDNKYGKNHGAMSINYQEAHAVIMLLHNFRHSLTGRQCVLFVDNTSVMWSLIKKWATSPGLMEYIHEIVLILSIYRISLRVEYISSSMNGLSDALSREEIERFHRIISDCGLELNHTATPLQYYPYLRLLREAPQ